MVIHQCPPVTTYGNSYGNNHGTNEKYKPAFEGAKFDKSGYCLRHPMIRLCKPATQGGTKLLPNGNAKPDSDSSSQEDATDGKGKGQVKYIIVRKTCHMCGEHALRNERKLSKPGWAHGYNAPQLMERKTQIAKEMVKCQTKDFVGSDIKVPKMVRRSSSGMSDYNNSNGSGYAPDYSTDSSAESPELMKQTHCHMRTPQSTRSRSSARAVKDASALAPPPYQEEGRRSRRAGRDSRPREKKSESRAPEKPRRESSLHSTRTSATQKPRDRSASAESRQSTMTSKTSKTTSTFNYAPTKKSSRAPRDSSMDSRKTTQTAAPSRSRSKRADPPLSRDLNSSIRDLNASAKDLDSSSKDLNSSGRDFHSSSQSLCAGMEYSRRRSSRVTKTSPPDAAFPNLERSTARAANRSSSRLSRRHSTYANTNGLSGNNVAASPSTANQETVKPVFSRRNTTDCLANFQAGSSVAHSEATMKVRNHASSFNSDNIGIINEDFNESFHAQDPSGKTKKMKELKPSTERRSSRRERSFQEKNDENGVKGRTRSRSSSLTTRDFSRQSSARSAASNSSGSSSCSPYREEKQQLPNARCSQNQEPQPSRGRSFFATNRDRASSKTSLLAKRIGSSKERKKSGSNCSTSHTSGTSNSSDASERARSASRSFSLTRRRSLSRTSRRVLNTTSTMDGNYDEEPSTMRYEVPFNPLTGKCNAHPNVCLARKNPRGGWDVVRAECPRCVHNY